MFVCRYGVFHFAGACRTVDTRLRAFKGCSRRFLFGALGHSLRSLHSCCLVGRADLTPSDLTTHVLPLRNLRVLDLTGCVELRAESFAAIADAQPGIQ